MPVQEVDLPLWHHGEGGSHPTDFGFKFKAGDVWHDIQVKMETIEIAISNGILCSKNIHFTTNFQFLYYVIEG